MVIELILAAAAASPDPDCAAKAIAAPATVVVQGATLPYVRCGEGSPTIVFEGGFGGNLHNWSSLLPMVAEFAPVFAYSRPGFRGTSGTWEADADGVRTSEESALLLREALRSSGVAPPYVLIGHSLGGLYIQKFAQLFPQETAGLVLMDNRPATLMKRCTDQGIQECVDTGVSPEWSPVLKMTFVGIEPSEAVAPSPRQLGDTPVLVLTAGLPEEGISQQFLQAVRDAQIEFAAGLKRGRQKIIANATHSSLSDEQAAETTAEIREFWRSVTGQR